MNITTALMNKVTVSVERETLARVKKFGSMDDTYDSVINKIIDELEECRKTRKK
jgi:hypothetical protein